MFTISMGDGCGMKTSHVIWRQSSAQLSGMGMDESHMEGHSSANGHGRITLQDCKHFFAFDTPGEWKDGGMGHFLSGMDGLYDRFWTGDGWAKEFQRNTRAGD